MSTSERCVNCEEPISEIPVYFNGEPYCCHGCVAGGPCVCTYLPPEVSAPPVASTDRAQSPAPAEPAVETDPRAPIPFRRAAPALVMARVRGLADQQQLLRFASALDIAPGLSEVSLTRIESDEAWFAVRAASAEQLAAAIVTIPDFTLAIQVVQDSVEVTVVTPAHAAPAEAASGPHDDTLLPPRPRFRVFRPTAADEPAANAPAPAPTPAPAPQPAPVPAASAVTPARPMAVPPAPTTSGPARPATARPTPPPAVEPARPVQTAAPAVPPAAAAPLTRPAAPSPAPAAPRQAERAAVREPDVQPAAAAAPEEMITPDARPGGALALSEHLTLVVYPFHSFAALNEFQAAIRGLRGVKNTRVRRFYRGTLHLAVDYEDIIPLAERLRDLRGVSFRIVTESRQEIELVLEESRSLVAAGEG